MTLAEKIINSEHTHLHPIATRLAYIRNFIPNLIDWWISVAPQKLKGTMHITRWEPEFHKIWEGWTQLFRSNVTPLSDYEQTWQVDCQFYSYT